MDLRVKRVQRQTKPLHPQANTVHWINICSGRSYNVLLANNLTFHHHQSFHLLPSFSQPPSLSNLFFQTNSKPLLKQSFFSAKFSYFLPSSPLCFHHNSLFHSTHTDRLLLIQFIWCVLNRWPNFH